jgi:glycosyltransferase involved in cell wall biosynthesis
MKVINVGIYPPPYGGISIHLKRLLEYLQSKRQECLLIDTSPYPKNLIDVANYSWRKTIWFLLFVSPKCIVHFHNFSLKNSLIYSILSFRHKTILSFHNERFLDEIYSAGSFWKLVVSFFLNHLDCFVVDTQRSKELAEKVVKDKSRVFVIPEFIPPSHIPLLENDVIMGMKKKHKYLLASNAFQISFYKNQDLYGLDILVELVRRLVQIDGMDVGMVFLLPNIGDEKYFEDINHRINVWGLTQYFTFIIEPIEESVSLWQISDAVIRATNTDGNSLTVLEALSVQIPVIASDCCERPEGTVLFKTRDVDDLCDKVTMVLSSHKFYCAQLKGIRRSDNAAALLKLYKDMGGKHESTR